MHVVTEVLCMWLRGCCTGGGSSAPRLSMARGRAVPTAKPSCLQATSASTGSKLDAHTAPNSPSWKTWRAPVTKPLMSSLSTILRSPSACMQADCLVTDASCSSGNSMFLVCHYLEHQCMQPQQPPAAPVNGLAKCLKMQRVHHQHRWNHWTDRATARDIH